MDYTNMTTEEVSAILAGAYDELARRETLARAPEQIEEARTQYIAASGRTDGDEWTQPAGVHDSYTEGDTTLHGGKTWVSIIDFNVWEPGVTGWRENVTEGYPAWVQPLGAHDAYATGAKVTHKGHIWQSSAASNVWEPGVYGWTDIGPA